MISETGLNALLNVTEECKPELGNVTTPLLSMVVKIVKERNLKVKSATPKHVQVLNLNFMVF